MFRFLVVALLLWSSGAPVFAQTEQPAPSKPAERIQSRAPADQKRPAARSQQACQLGLISIVGNKFEMTDIGPLDLAFMVKYSHDRADWGLDNVVFARVRAAAPGLNVQNIAYDKEELRRAAQEHRLLRSSANEIRDFARKTAANTHCDRYIVVHRGTGQIDGQPAVAVGFGAIRLKSMLGKQTAYLHVLTSIRIYDGASFELIKAAPASMGDDPGPFEVPKNYKPVRGPARQIDVASLPATPQQAARNPAYRAIIESLLATSLDKTLPGLLR
jgi:hypothetical protein